MTMGMMITRGQRTTTTIIIMETIMARTVKTSMIIITKAVVKMTMMTIET